MEFRPFIYGLVDPAESNHVRYVGMTCKRVTRPHDHANRARKAVGHSHLLHWIRKIQAEGREPHVLVLEEFSPGAHRNFVGFIEQCYIKSLRTIGHRLTNVTDGGETGSEGPFATEFRAKVGVASKRYWQDPEYRLKMKEARIGLKRSALARANMSKAQKGRKKSEMTKTRLALANLGKVASPETCAKQSASIKAAKTTTEARLTASIKQKAVWARRRAQKAGVSSTLDL